MCCCEEQIRRAWHSKTVMEAGTIFFFRIRIAKHSPDGAFWLRPVGYIYGKREASDVNNLIITYGLTAEQLALLRAAVLERYEVTAADCVTDLIVTNAVCTVIDATKMGEDALRSLLAYYMDVGDRLNETVVWLGKAELPELPSFERYNSFLDLLTDLDDILSRAQDRYDTMQMYTSEYGYLPRHAIEESLEVDVYTALHRKFGDNPDAHTVGQVLRQWQAVLEAGAAEELAAVYELTRWLKGQGYHYEIKCATPFPLLLELLDIAEVKPRCETLETGYTFILPRCLESQIEQWQKHHWLSKRVDYDHRRMLQFVFWE